MEISRDLEISRVLNFQQPLEFSRRPGNFQVLEISRPPGKFQDPGYFQAPWKIPGGSLSPVRHAVMVMMLSINIKYSFVFDIFLSIIEIYLSNIHHHELNTNKSINRKIPIILTAKFNRIMLKEIFAEQSLTPIELGCFGKPENHN